MWIPINTSDQGVCSDCYCIRVFLSVTTTSRACPTAVQKFHVATSISALMLHIEHTYYTLHMGTPHTHIQKVACHFSSPSRGHREHRNLLDAATFVVLCFCSWFTSRVCQYVYSDASGSSPPKCQLHKQSQMVSELLSMTAERALYLLRHCQLSRSWKLGWKKVFAP